MPNINIDDKIKKVARAAAKEIMAEYDTKSQDKKIINSKIHIMKQDDIIQMAYKYLNDVPDIRKRIKLIDANLKNNTYNTDTINKIKLEQHRLQHRLSKIINAVCKLNDENQRIICYRYFDKLSYVEIGKRIGHRADTASRRSKELLLDIGRLMFGFEDEFWMGIL